MGSHKRAIALFDLDGTLTVSRQRASKRVLSFLRLLRSRVAIGLVSSSDLSKQKEQLGDNVLDIFDYSFCENGVLAYKGQDEISRSSIRDYLTPAQRLLFANWTLAYIARLDIPVKTGTFIELRTGTYNVSLCGRNCAYHERMVFCEFDRRLHLRQQICEAYRRELGDLNLVFALGGQTSVDIFPAEWTKAYCLQFLEREYEEIHFFGDNTMEGGNDYEIFVSPKTIGHTVNDPEDTIRQCCDVFGLAFDVADEVSSFR
jgi:phosphomannomutase